MLKYFKIFLVILIIISINCEKKPTLTENQQLIKSFLPQENQVSDWKLKSELRFFQAGNLWELIDGAAEGYISYGFQEMVTSEFINKNTKEEVIIEIYQMKDNANGFGIYSAERYPENKFLDIGTQGYESSMVLNFWKDKYYVKLSGFDTTASVQKSLNDLAFAIDNNIPAEKVMPKFISYFPQENIIKNSEKFIANSFLGHEFLKNGYTADYKIENKEVKFFFIDCENQETTKSSFEKYKDYIKTSGKITSVIKGTGDEGFVGKDNYYGIITIIKKGNIIMGVLGAPDQKVGLKLLKDALNNIG